MTTSGLLPHLHNREVWGVIWKSNSSNRWANVGWACPWRTSADEALAEVERVLATDPAFATAYQDGTFFPVRLDFTLVAAPLPPGQKVPIINTKRTEWPTT